LAAYTALKSPYAAHFNARRVGSQETDNFPEKKRRKSKLHRDLGHDSLIKTYRGQTLPHPLPSVCRWARCPDGVVEAIESESPDWFAFGTQFHPEADSASALDVRIFEEYLDGVHAHCGEFREIHMLVA